MHVKGFDRKTARLAALRSSRDEYSANRAEQSRLTSESPTRLRGKKVGNFDRPPLHPAPPSTAIDRYEERCAVQVQDAWPFPNVQWEPPEHIGKTSASIHGAPLPHDRRMDVVKHLADWHAEHPNDEEAADAHRKIQKFHDFEAKNEAFSKRHPRPPSKEKHLSIPERGEGSGRNGHRGVTAGIAALGLDTLAIGDVMARFPSQQVREAYPEASRSSTTSGGARRGRVGRRRALDVLRRVLNLDEEEEAAGGETEAWLGRVWRLVKKDAHLETAEWTHLHATLLMLAQGKLGERIDAVFRVFDVDMDGLLRETELAELIAGMSSPLWDLPTARAQYAKAVEPRGGVPWTNGTLYHTKPTDERVCALAGSIANAAMQQGGARPSQGSVCARCGRGLECRCCGGGGAVPESRDDDVIFAIQVHDEPSMQGSMQGGRVQPMRVAVPRQHRVQTERAKAALEPLSTGLQQKGWQPNPRNRISAASYRQGFLAAGAVPWGVEEAVRWRQILDETRDPPHLTPAGTSTAHEDRSAVGWGQERGTGAGDRIATPRQETKKRRAGQRPPGASGHGGRVMGKAGPVYPCTAELKQAWSTGVVPLGPPKLDSPRNSGLGAILYPFFTPINPMLTSPPSFHALGKEHSFEERMANEDRALHRTRNFQPRQLAREQMGLAADGDGHFVGSGGLDPELKDSWTWAPKNAREAEAQRKRDMTWNETGLLWEEGQGKRVFEEGEQPPEWKQRPATATHARNLHGADDAVVAPPPRGTGGGSFRSGGSAAGTAPPSLGSLAGSRASSQNPVIKTARISGLAGARGS